MIPEPLRAWLVDIADCMQIPPDFSSASAIVILSALLGRKIGILPKKKDDWHVIPNLWGGVVGRPALLKSPAIAEVMKPLNKLVDDAIKSPQEDLKDYEFKAMEASAIKDALKSQNTKEAKKKEPDFKQIRDQHLDQDIPHKPTLKRYKTEDGTTEKIGEILVENPNGILIHRDELSGWFKSMDKDGREGDRAFYLESWNGSDSFTMDRISRGTPHIPALCLSILGGIQPGPLSALFIKY